MGHDLPLWALEPVADGPARQLRPCRVRRASAVANRFPANGVPRALTAAVRPRRVEVEAVPGAAQGQRPGLGRERLRHPDLRLLALRGEADRVRGRRLPGDRGDHPRARRARRPRRLVDRADRLSEARRVAAAVGDPRARLGLDAARLPLRAPDRGLPLLAATGDRATAAVARQGAADRGVAADDPRRRPLRRGDRGGRSTCCSPTASRSPGSPPGGSTRPRSRSCWRSGACSGYATRSPSSPGARRSTASCSPSRCFRSRT